MDNKKKKIIIIAWAAIWLLVIIWIIAYFFLPKEETAQQPTVEQKEEPENTVQQINYDELCKQQYWNNSTQWNPGYCTCVPWYEWNNGRTRCVKSRKENWITKKYEVKDENTFIWEWFEGENAVSLAPIWIGQAWQKFEEKSYTVDADPDYKYEPGEEEINMIEEKTKITAIHDEDEDYLWEIINDINTKKKRNKDFSNKNNTNSQNIENTNVNNWESSLIETFIGAIETKQTNEGIVYYYTFTDPSFWTTPVRIWFVSKTKITNNDITTDIGWMGININKLKFHGWITNAEVTKDFWITRCWLFEPEGYIFKPWENKFSLKWSWEDGFTYINHFKSSIYPVFAFPWSELSQWNKNCMVEIWRKENFSKFPFEIKWSFENAVVAVTKNKDASSNCSALLGNHDNTIVIYNEELACEIWYKNWTTLREITTK